MKLHPALDPYYPEGVSAFRQLSAGAKVTFRAGSWDIFNREGYDHLYYRGLALRHSNGETGKYETFTYVATPELLQWAREHLTFPTITDTLAKNGINVKEATRRYRISRAAEARQDRTKFFASSLGKGLYLADQQCRDLDLLSWTTNTADYIAAWCRANHLKGT